MQAQCITLRPSLQTKKKNLTVARAKVFRQYIIYKHLSELLSFNIFQIVFSHQGIRRFPELAPCPKELTVSSSDFTLDSMLSTAGLETNFRPDRQSSKPWGDDIVVSLIFPHSKISWSLN